MFHLHHQPCFQQIGPRIEQLQRRRLRQPRPNGNPEGSCGMATLPRGGYKGVYIERDVMGRPVRETKPVKMSSAWNLKETPPGWQWRGTGAPGSEEGALQSWDW